MEDELNGDYTEYIFFLGNEKTVSCKDFGDGKFYFFDAYSPRIGTPDGVYSGMTIKQLLTMKGVKADPGELIRLTLNGYSIDIGGYQNLTAYGTKVFNNAYAKGTEVKISNACFKPGAKIICISMY